MSELRVCKALVWKELRSWWSTVLIALVVFPLLIYTGSTSSGGGMLRLVATLTPVIFVLFIAFWGASKSVNENGSKEFADTNLPVQPYIRWLASFVLPAFTAGLLKYWLLLSPNLTSIICLLMSDI